MEKVTYSRRFFLSPITDSPPGQKLNTNQDLGIKVATPVGTLVGQLLFGWLADIVGRKRMCKHHLSRETFAYSIDL
jgi:MFS family permease